MNQNYSKISLIHSLKESESENIVLEILHERDITHVASMVDPTIIDIVKINFHSKGKSREKIITLPVSNGKIKKITFFFPESKDLMDERSTFFQKISSKSLFIPSEKSKDAHEALILSTYSYQKYLSEKKESSYEILVSLKEKSEIEKRIPLYDAIFEARNMVNQPASFAYPELLVEYITSQNWKNFDVHVFDHEALKKMGCNLLLAVGVGSDFPPYMVVMTPKNPPKGEKYALIGKGVTFDAGGIQIKPDTAMLDMKCDKSGAAGMYGVAKYLDSLDKLPANVIIAMGFTENMTGGKAFKPLDIYKAYNGTTVEIHHTDAEGRLVLADVMSYVESTYKVDHIITMATLTGACVYALGHDIAGIMGDDEEVIQSLLDADSPYEPLWRLPLNEKLKKSLKAEIADLKNVARSEKAGSSIGGAFLSYFQGKAKLTHLDIAGPAYRETLWGYMPKGGTGWGVRILSDFICSLGSKKGSKNSSVKSGK